MDGHDESRAPRRQLLDGTLAEAAVAAGAEFRDGTRVVDLIEDGDAVAGVVTLSQDGRRHTEGARLVIGAAGPGWALVGDAGMKKDPVTAQGISTAFRCAEMLAEAADDGLSGRRPLEDALAAYGEARDAWLLPYYRFTAQLARFARPTDTLAAYYRAIQPDPAATARLFGCVALTHSPEDVLPQA